MKKYVQLITFTCVLIAVIGLIGGMISNTAVKATVVKVKPLTVENSVTCTGKVERVAVRSVYPPTAAAVKETYVKVGDKVEAGSPLLNIVSTPVVPDTTSLQETYAALLSGYTTQGEVPAVGDVEEEEEQVLTAPISGEITAVSVSSQGTLEFGKPAVTIASDEGLQVRLSVNESQISEIQVGQKAEITGVGFKNSVYTGTVKSISSEAKQLISATGQETVVEVVVSVDSPGDDIKPGFSAKAKIITEQNDNVLIAPYEAVRAEKDGSEYVYKLEGQRVIKTPIQTSGEYEDGFEVQMGLSNNDKIVVNPDSVSNGARVIPQGEEEHTDD